MASGDCLRLKKTIKDHFTSQRPLQSLKLLEISNFEHKTTLIVKFFKKNHIYLAVLKNNSVTNVKMCFGKTGQRYISCLVDAPSQPSLRLRQYSSKVAARWI